MPKSGTGKDLSKRIPLTRVTTALGPIPTTAPHLGLPTSHLSAAMPKYKPLSDARVKALLLWNSLYWRPHFGLNAKTKEDLIEQNSIQPPPTPRRLVKNQMVEFLTNGWDPNYNIEGQPEVDTTEHNIITLMMEWLLAQVLGYHMSAGSRDGGEWNYTEATYTTNLGDQTAEQRAETFEEIADAMREVYLHNRELPDREDYAYWYRPIMQEEVVPAAPAKIPGSAEPVQFGKHFGNTRAWIWLNDPDYCNWALNVYQPRGKGLVEFQQWVKLMNEADPTYLKNKVKSRRQPKTDRRRVATAPGPTKKLGMIFKREPCRRCGGPVRPPKPATKVVPDIREGKFGYGDYNDHSFLFVKGRWVEMAGGFKSLPRPSSR